jgi:NitT/TauT family transport system substrate-binding protein
MQKRHFLQAIAATTLAAGIAPAFAQALTPIKFQLDWRFEGPAWPPAPTTSGLPTWPR